MQRRLVYDTKKASLEMRDVVVGKQGMLQWKKRDVAVGNNKRMAAPVSGRERKRRRPGGETEVIGSQALPEVKGR